MCLRCSPGLFRHACGVTSCHTSSMPAKPHLGLTQNSSPTTLANGRRAAQIAESRGSASGRWPQPAKFPPAAAGETPAPRTARNPQVSQSAIRRWRNPRPRAMVRAATPAGWTAWTIHHRRTGYRPPMHQCEYVPCCAAGASPRPTWWKQSVLLSIWGGAARRRDTQVPPYVLYGQFVVLSGGKSVPVSLQQWYYGTFCYFLQSFPSISLQSKKYFSFFPGSRLFLVQSAQIPLFSGCHIVTSPFLL